MEERRSNKTSKPERGTRCDDRSGTLFVLRRQRQSYNYQSFPSTPRLRMPSGKTKSSKYYRGRRRRRLPKGVGALVLL